MGPRLPLRFCALAALTLATLGVGLSAPGTASSTTAVPIAWGCRTISDYGQCSVSSGPGDLTSIVASSSGYFSLGLKSDGTVVAWGCLADRDFGQCNVPIGLAGVTAIAAGASHSLALKNDGTVVAWGCGTTGGHGQCSVPMGLSDVTAIAGNAYDSLALKSDGTVVAWGCAGNDVGQCSVPAGLTGVTAIAAGPGHSLALKGDRTVVAWGCGSGWDAGQCNVPVGLAGVTAIGVGAGHSLALKADRTVVAWGCGTGIEWGQCSVPGGLSGVTAISAGWYHSLALKGDGSVVSWGCGGFTDWGQCSVPAGLTGATAISAGLWHSVAMVMRLDQTISFSPLANRRYGELNFPISASASSGLPVTFAATGNCFVYLATAYIIGAGSCTITASQHGNVSYNAAPDVSQTFAIAKASQTILFEPIPNKTFGDADFPISATASSLLPVSFRANGRCSISGFWTVHLTGPGACTVTASQAGDANFNAAMDFPESFLIGPRHTARRCRVPRVVGKPVPAARRLIASRHCRTGKVGRAYSQRRKRGVVISQSRRPGRVLPAGSKINLLVSRGRKR
jgi:Regulator of chromosome condensation (RCC1) repeat/PASTA domain